MQAALVKGSICRLHTPSSYAISEMEHSCCNAVALPRCFPFAALPPALPAVCGSAAWRPVMQCWSCHSHVSWLQLHTSSGATCTLQVTCAESGCRLLHAAQEPRACCRQDQPGPANVLPARQPARCGKNMRVRSAGGILCRFRSGACMGLLSHFQASHRSLHGCDCA